MTCTTIDLGDGAIAIVCTRGQSTRARECAFCRASTKEYKLCDFPLRGKRAGATCSKPMCARCATVIGDNRDLCPPHAKMAREHGLDVTLLSQEQGDPGKQVALDQLEERGAPITPKARAAAMRPMKFRQHKRHDGSIISAVADWQEFVTERAAIGEYLGELSREDAERQARELAGARPGR